MSATIDDIIEQKVKECVAAELEPFRSLLLHLSNSGETPVEPLVDAPEAAAMLGLDVSTDEAKRRACQKVYYLTRIGLPYVRTGKRQKSFDPAAVRKWIAAGGIKRDDL